MAVTSELPDRPKSFGSNREAPAAGFLPGRYYEMVLKGRPDVCPYKNTSAGRFIQCFFLELTALPIRGTVHQY